MARPRLRLDRRPPCAVCGSRFEWVLHLAGDGGRIRLGCPRTQSLADMLLVACRELCRLGP